MDNPNSYHIESEIRMVGILSFLEIRHTIIAYLCKYYFYKCTSHDTLLNLSSIG